jgi:hypothetical protein
VSLRTWVTVELSVAERVEPVPDHRPLEETTDQAFRRYAP